ncbi:MAG: hypothetical protein WCF03_13995 [Nitrososphaeraceae archaeon]
MDIVTKIESGFGGMQYTSVCNLLLRNKLKYYSFRKSSQAGPDSGQKEALSSQVSLVPISFPLDIASILDGLIYGGAILVFSDASGVMDRFGISDYW